jgi:hypothetical protein
MTALMNYREASLGDRMAYAEMLANSGTLIRKELWAEVADITGAKSFRPSAGMIFHILETGDSLGIHPMTALMVINIIDGKPTIPPTLVAALVREAGHELRVATTGTVLEGNFSAVWTLVRKDDRNFTFAAEWTLQRAAAAGLVNYSRVNGVWTLSPVDDNEFSRSWVQYPEQLTKARALGEVTDEGAQDVKMGLHTPEEMGAAVNSAGEMIAPPKAKPAEPAEDWLELLAEAKTFEESVEVGKRIIAAGQYTGAVRTAAMKRGGELKRAEPAAEPDLKVVAEARQAKFFSGTDAPDA